MPFAPNLGILAVTPRIELEHSALDLADQGNAAACERAWIAQPTAVDSRLEALAHVGRQHARIDFGPELRPVGRQLLQRVYENGSGSTALGILISGGP